MLRLDFQLAALGTVPSTDATRQRWDLLTLEMLSDEQRRFLEATRVAHLATADAAGAPHVVPVCFAVVDDTIYITIDEKPKRVTARALKRLRNIAQNPKVALVADRYDDHDWSRLGWVMVRGRAELIAAGPEHAQAQRVLRRRYKQLIDMAIERHPVIAIRIEHTTSWGRLTDNGASAIEPNPSPP